MRFFIIAILFFSSVRSLAASEREASIEEKLQVAFLYQFTKYVEWSTSPKSSEFHILVVEDKPLFSAIKKFMKDKRVQSAEILVDFIEHENLDKIQNLPQMIVLPRGNPKSIMNHLKNRKRDGSLVIGYGPSMEELGASINFYVQDDHLKFEINMSNAAENHLTFSSQILRLGRLVDSK